MKAEPKFTEKDFVKRNGFWKIRLRGDDGKIKFISTRQQDLRNALAVANDTGAKKIMEARRIGLEVTASIVSQLQFGSNTTICDLLDEWHEYLLSTRALNTAVNAKIQINQFITFCGLRKMHPMQVRPEHVNHYINSESDKCRATRKIHLTNIKSFFKWMNAMGYCPNNPALLVRVDYSKIPHHKMERKVRTPYTKAELERINKLCEPYRSMCWIALYSGLRLCDVESLEWDSIGDTVITKWTKKNQRRLEIEITPELRSVIQSIPRVSSYVFPEVHAGRYGRDALYAKLKEVGMNKSFHSLRHTYACNLLDSGKPVWFIRQALGHGDEVTTAGYLNNRAGNLLARRRMAWRYNLPDVAPHVSDHHSQFA